MNIKENLYLNPEEDHTSEVVLKSQHIIFPLFQTFKISNQKILLQKKEILWKQ